MLSDCANRQSQEVLAQQLHASRRQEIRSRQEIYQCGSYWCYTPGGPSTTHTRTQTHTLTLLEHARLPALAQPALLALASHVQVHLAVAVVLAGVLGALDDAASEEALAALAAQHVVVEARGLVAAHAAHLVAEHLGGGALLPLHRLPICAQK